MNIKPFTLSRWLKGEDVPYVEHQKELLAIQDWFRERIKEFSSKSLRDWIAYWKTDTNTVAEFCQERESVVIGWVDGSVDISYKDRNKLITLMVHESI